MGISHAALVGGGDGDGRVGLSNVGAEWCVHARVVTHRRIATWARAAGECVTRGQNRGRSCLAVTGEARRVTSSARGRKMLPRGGFRRGRSRFCGPVGDFHGAGGSTWPGGLSCTRVRRPAGLPTMGHGRGRREEGEGDGSDVREAKIAGA
jgi:hypothetical protein